MHRPRCLGRRRERPSVESGKDVERELGHPAHLVVDAAQQLALHLEVDERVAGLPFDTQLADLDPAPADQLARRPRSLLGDHHPNAAQDEPRVREREDRVAGRRVIAPRDPALRILLRAQPRQDGLDRRDHLVRDGIGVRRHGAPVAEAHAGPLLPGVSPVPARLAHGHHWT